MSIARPPGRDGGGHQLRLQHKLTPGGPSQAVLQCGASLGVLYSLSAESTFSSNLVAAATLDQRSPSLSSTASGAATISDVNPGLYRVAPTRWGKRYSSSSRRKKSLRSRPSLTRRQVIAAGEAQIARHRYDAAAAFSQPLLTSFDLPFDPRTNDADAIPSR